MKISIKDLKKLCEKILTKAEQSGLNKVEVNVDYYRNIGDLYNLDIETPALTIGSFIDDWESLQKILNGKNTPTTLDLERLSNVIKIIGNSITKSGNLIL